MIAIEEIDELGSRDRETAVLRHGRNAASFVGAHDEAVVVEVHGRQVQVDICCLPMSPFEACPSPVSEHEVTRTDGRFRSKFL